MFLIQALTVSSTSNAFNTKHVITSSAYNAVTKQETSLILFKVHHVGLRLHLHAQFRYLIAKNHIYSEQSE